MSEIQRGWFSTIFKLLHMQNVFFKNCPISGTCRTENFFAQRLIFNNLTFLYDFTLVLYFILILVLFPLSHLVILLTCSGCYVIKHSPDLVSIIKERSVHSNAFSRRLRKYFTRDVFDANKIFEILNDN